MGCCYSSSMDDPQQQDHQNHAEEDPPMTKFSFSDLNMATENFSSKNIVSDSGGESSNVVYKGRLENLGFIAVKKFKKMACPDPNTFAEEAQRVGGLKHRRLVNLIGYCCDGDEMLLVAEFMPCDTLAKHLFQRSNQTMEWAMRLRVACCIAEALDYCGSSGFSSYNNLSAYTVLFDENGEACLSCFGLMKKSMDDQITTGSVNPENVIFRFGTILLDLLSGKQIPPNHAPEMIHGKNFTELIDPNLKGNFCAEEAIVIFKLASQCLHCEGIESINTKELLTTLETMQKKTVVRNRSNTMLEMEKHQEVFLNQLSPLGEACLRMDLTTIHKILVMAEYKDDKEVIEFSFEEWIEAVQDLQEVRKRGDQAFLKKDFETAIDCYSKFIGSRRVVYPSIYARRSLCYMFCNNPDRALYDGMRAQGVFPDWPTALYMQSVALSKLNMLTDSADTLKDAILFEAERQHHDEES